MCNRKFTDLKLAREVQIRYEIEKFNEKKVTTENQRSTWSGTNQNFWLYNFQQRNQIEF